MLTVQFQNVIPYLIALDFSRSCLHNAVPKNAFCFNYKFPIIQCQSLNSFTTLLERKRSGSLLASAHDYYSLALSTSTLNLLSPPEVLIGFYIAPILLVHRPCKHLMVSKS